MPPPLPSTQEEIAAALVQLRNWDVVEQQAHTELHRLFNFSSFSDAIHFMSTASRFINVTDHHPRWQNVYSKVEVWLTTGELKHKLSSKDLKLANYLEDLFQNYQANKF